MGKIRLTTSAENARLAVGCRSAVTLAGDPLKLSDATEVQLRTAIAHVAKFFALLEDDDSRLPAGFRARGAVDELERVGVAIAEEIRRRGPVSAGG